MGRGAQTRTLQSSDHQMAPLDEARGVENALDEGDTNDVGVIARGELYCSQRKNGAFVATDLNPVTPEHQLPHHDASDPAGSPDDKHSGVLGLGDGELAHRSPDECGVEEAVIRHGGGGPRELAQPRELAPHLIEHLPRLAAETHRIHVVQSD